MSKPTDLVQGTLDLLLLRVLSLEPMHGWAIAQRIRQMSNEHHRGRHRSERDDGDSLSAACSEPCRSLMLTD
jgi:hypothetical protein